MAKKTTKKAAAADPQPLNYPLTDGHRKHFVRHPILVTPDIAKKQKETNIPALALEPGKWIAVDVLLPSGYSHLISPVQFNTEADCQRVCDVHNKFHGFDKDAVTKIVALSMGLPMPTL